MAENDNASQVPPSGRDDVPRGSVQRGVKIAGLPLGFAGRTALGIARRIGGESAELVAQQIQERTAEQLFRVLGELKGGAMKVGQALSIFEAALPPELAEPYRATLTRLQESAPPLPTTTVYRVLAADFGEDWQEKFESFDDTPAAAGVSSKDSNFSCQSSPKSAASTRYTVVVGSGGADSCSRVSVARYGSASSGGSAASKIDSAWPTFIAPPLSSPSTRNSCSAVRS